MKVAIFSGHPPEEHSRMSRMSESSGSETSQGVCGHHETWDDIVDNQAKQVQFKFILS